MAVDIKDIYWLAGLIEGEGCFGIYVNVPRLQIAMTDRDTIEKCCRILNANIYNNSSNPSKPDHYKDRYECVIRGQVAIEWMLTLYSLMSKRRQNKILQILEDWKKVPIKNIYYDKGVRYCRLHGKISGANLRYVGKYIRCQACRTSWRLANEYSSKSEISNRSN